MAVCSCKSDGSQGRRAVDRQRPTKLRYGRVRDHDGEEFDVASVSLAHVKTAVNASSVSISRSTEDLSA